MTNYIHKFSLELQEEITKKLPKIEINYRDVYKLKNLLTREEYETVKFFIMFPHQFLTYLKECNISNYLEYNDKVIVLHNSKIPVGGDRIYFFDIYRFLYDTTELSEEEIFYIYLELIKAKEKYPKLYNWILKEESINIFN